MTIYTPLGKTSSAEIGEVGRIALRFAEPLVVERARTSLGRVALKHEG